MRKRGYVLKVAIASAAIGCGSPKETPSDHPVGMVAEPPRPAPDPSASAAPPAPSQPVPEVGTIAKAPDAKDAGAPAKTTPSATPTAAPKPAPHKVGTIAAPPDLTVGTTAHAPDNQPPTKK